MTGLIKKDFLLIKSNLKFLVILFIVYGFMAFNGETDISFILPFMSVVIMLSTFSYDIYNKWDAYVIALPDGRKNTVKAKYLATIILLSLITLMIFIFTITNYLQIKTLNIVEISQMFLSLYLATIIFQAIMYPVIYKFGIEKARIGIFVGVFGFGFIASLLSKIIDFKPLIQKLSFLNNYWMFTLPIVSLIILYISYKVSKKVYEKKQY